jgi:hypothetical protein
MIWSFKSILVDFVDNLCQDETLLLLIVSMSCPTCSNTILCLHFSKFKYSIKNNIRKNKGRSKTVKPNRCKSLSNMIVTAPFLTRC